MKTTAQTENKHITVGVTGPTGAGKSTLRPVTDRLGFVWLDTDIIAREIVMPGEPALAELAECFGEDIILPDGSLDRALLASRAFPTQEGCGRLNAITHPRVIERLRVLSRQAFDSGKHVIIDAPLLFEAGVDAMCNEVIAVLAPVEVRMNRIMRRDGLTQEQALARISAQKPDDYYAARSGYTMYNDGGVGEFLCSARTVFGDILHKHIDVNVNQY